MNARLKIFSIVVVFSCIFNTYAQESVEEISIENGWKMMTGDNPEFANPGYDDSDWKEIRTGELWENQGFAEYDGVAYYRLKIIVPSSLKKGNKFIDGVKLSLGRIAFSNRTFFNGTEIGSLDRMNIPTEYVVPFSIIKWDKENVIAVRVHDYWGGGGLCSGEYTLGLLETFPEYITIKTDNDLIDSDQSQDTLITKRLNFVLGKAFTSLPSQIGVKISDIKTNEVYFNNVFGITIGTEAGSSFQYSFNIKKAGWYRADYFLFSEYLKDSVISSTLLAYKQEDHSTDHLACQIANRVIPSNSFPFALNDVHLDGYLGDRVNANITERLLNIDEKGILECFYNRPGAQAWVGEYVGKYLHAAARAWENSKNEQLKVQMDRIADILISCQKDDGYLGTYIPYNYWTEWDVWAHKYDLLGLLSYYSFTCYKPALYASVNVGNLICKTFGTKPGQLNIEETGYHVGMASCSILEAMVELYRFTGDDKYLEFCKYIIDAYEHPKGPKIISTLNTIGKVDKTANAKAYEMMSNFTGIVKLYQHTGEQKLISAMETAWKDISANKIYITGTSSKGELFQKDFVLPAETSDHMGEGCVTTTWLQFNQALFYLTGDPKYMDEIEKTIYNHLLAAENPQTGCVSYYTALQGEKPFKCNISGHCCLASVPRGIVAIPELIYTKNTDGEISINIYADGKISSSITLKDGKKIPVTCSIKSRFPEDGKIEIVLETIEKAEFNLSLRIPVWCKNFKAEYAGKSFTGTPGQYLNIRENWNTKSEIKVSFDLNVHLLDGGKSYPGYVAVKSGPQILAIDQTLNPKLTDFDKITIDQVNLTPVSSELLPAGWVGTQVYGTPAFYHGKPVTLLLVPFADAGQNGGEVNVWIKKI